MKKFSFFVVLILTATIGFSQALYNEWIDYSKTYYKFKVGNTGLCRIYGSELAGKGLGGEPVENLRLYRNGKQIAIYTSVASGPLPSTGYIEFWGEKNDGVNDRDVYRDPSYQLSDKISLFSDVAAYFLTSTTTGTGLRYSNVPNNVAGNTLPAEPYFIYSLRNDFRDRIHRGRALVASGEYVYSSSYDMGEFFASADINPATPLTINFNDLYAATAGPAATFRVGMAGSAPNGSPIPGRQRRYAVELNNNRIIDTFINQFDARINYNRSVPVSLIAGNNASFAIKDLMAPDTFAFDRIVCSFIELNYPRQFNFGNKTNFTFSLSASATNRYIEINNFNAGSSTPVLYDLTSGRRYLADQSGTTLRFVLFPSSTQTDFVLVSQATNNINTITGLEQRQFVNFSNAANQGNYIIISHPTLRFSAPYDPVEQYRVYRSSTQGGNFNAKIYDINELTDQFGYGINKNPLAIKNFLKYARQHFGQAPEFAFIIGKGLTYQDFRENEYSPFAERLNLVPTFGYPASDNLLASDNLNPVMNTFIGRLSAVTPQEVLDYLDKIKQYEQAQQSTVQTLDNKAWMKNVVHVIGANDDNLFRWLKGYMDNYERIISDTLFGGVVTDFNKEQTGPVTPIVSTLMSSLFEKGISLLTYFGHSSATSLDYNLDDPAAYNNTGKYPIFLVSGCNAGNLYSFDTSRFGVLGTLSEKFVLAKNKGSIGFIASTHFGIDTYLNFYNEKLYRAMSSDGYGKSIAFSMKETMDAINSYYGTDFLGGRLHAEQATLHGDPALKLNSHAKPDYVIEEPLVEIIPNILSVADNQFTVRVKAFNIGKATGDSVRWLVKRVYSDNTDTVIYSEKRKAIRSIDSIKITVPMTGLRDKGENKIIATIDSDNNWDELSESNNTAAKTFTVYEDELTPIYPPNYGIVNKTQIKLSASTANPIIPVRDYVMEFDTTELFNSSYKISKTVTSAGGLIEFDPGVNFTDSTVYYWRVAPSVPGQPRWNTSSFMYLNASGAGYNQSHFYQHTKSEVKDIYIDSASRRWKFSNKPNTLTIVNSIYPTSGNEDGHFSIAINGDVKIASACLGHSVIFNVFDPLTLRPLYNQTQPSVVKSGTAGGFMGSAGVCLPTRQYNFEFSYLDSTGRRKMRDFMDWVPSGYYVTARLILDAPYDSILVDKWQADEAVYGANNSAYSRLKNAGFTSLDNFTSARTWAFVYRKNVTSYAPVSAMSTGLSDRITLNASIETPSMVGFITSPVFGPAKTWKDVKWRGFSLESNPKDDYNVKVLGIRPNGSADTLYTLTAAQQDFNISSVSTTQYPYLRLAMMNRELDSAAITPYQLRYWRILYDPLPEGAIAPNLATLLKDTVEKGEPVVLRIPFKNVSDAAFTDSIKVRLVVTKAGQPDTIRVASKKALLPGDTAVLSYNIDTKNLTDLNTLYLGFNAALEQPEQYRFNNFLYKNFFIKPDIYYPLMDVTFDGTHILNGDIVSARPKIVAKIKDESKFMALDDTSLASVFIKYPGPNGRLQRFAFGTDTLRFVPANVATGKNEASIEFSPTFLEDTDDDSYYTLIVRGKDKSGNPTGNNEYRVNFKVINKAMISDMFNYPNPFTSSTAFVFTLTGSEVPNNLRIQVLTVTGKIVKEITKQELGPLRIGRNITEYKWDGTDQYGGKLGNGVYLYRVITSLNGNSLERYSLKDQSGNSLNTDKYFNKGYGKMYLMR